MVTVRACRIDQDRSSQPGSFHPLAKHRLGGRGAADVAHADEQNGNLFFTLHIQKQSPKMGSFYCISDHFKSICCQIVWGKIFASQRHFESGNEDILCAVFAIHDRDIMNIEQQSYRIDLEFQRTKAIDDGIESGGLADEHAGTDHALEVIAQRG